MMTVAVRATPVLVLGAHGGRMGCCHQDHVRVPGISGGSSLAVQNVPDHKKDCLVYAAYPTSRKRGRLAFACLDDLPLAVGEDVPAGTLNARRKSYQTLGRGTRAPLVFFTALWQHKTVVLTAADHHQGARDRRGCGSPCCASGSRSRVRSFHSIRRGRIQGNNASKFEI